MTSEDTASDANPQRGTTRLPALGRRGEGWVALQVALIGTLLATGLSGPRWPRAGRWLRRGAAAPLAAGGAWMLVAGGSAHGRKLTPFPKPVADSPLRNDGPYGLVRHPMYGGVVLLAAAWTLVSSPATVIPTALGAVFVEAKRRREEAWLAEQHPGYEAYREAVPRSLIPWVW